MREDEREPVANEAVFLAALPSRIRDVVSGFLAASGSPENWDGVRAAAARLDGWVAAFEEEAEQREFVDVVRARRVAKACREMLDGSPVGRSRRLVLAAIDSLSRLDDAEDDPSLFGLDDDDRLFRLLNEGFPADADDGAVLERHFDSGAGLEQDGFVVAPLRSPTFDDGRFEILGGVRFRNDVLQEVLRLLSLSAEGKGGPRGRISNAQLGINQLGAVYEALLSKRVRLAKCDAEVLGGAEFCTLADLMAETTLRLHGPAHPEGREFRLLGLRYDDPGLEPRMTRVYPTAWTRHDREADYRAA